MANSISLKEPSLHIDAMAILKNLNTIKANTRARIMAVVKCDGYGLGLSSYAGMLSAMGIERFAVGSAAEALQLRREGTRGEILVLTPVFNEQEILELAQINVGVQLSSAQQMEAIAAALKGAKYRLNMHLALDTGLGRWGFLPDELAQALPQIKELSVLGTYSHLAAPYGDDERTKAQAACFEKMTGMIKDAGVDPGVRHICASGGFLNHPALHMDMVRIGSALVGGVPRADEHGLIPVAGLHAQIRQIKTLKKGEKLGYGDGAALRRDTRVAIINAGKREGIRAHGEEANAIVRMLRRVTGRTAHGYAQVGGKFAPVLGVPGTNHVCLDITDIEEAQVLDMASFSINPLYCAGNVERVWCEEISSVPKLCFIAD